MDRTHPPGAVLRSGMRLVCAGPGCGWCARAEAGDLRKDPPFLVPGEQAPELPLPSGCILRRIQIWTAPALERAQGEG